MRELSPAKPADRIVRSAAAARAGTVTAVTILITLLILDAAILVLTAVHGALGEPVSFIASFFSLEKEATLPAWYASVKLLFVAVLLALLAVGSRPRARPDRVLLAAAGLFLLMSCDESAGIHERLQNSLDKKVLAATFDAEGTLVAAKVLLGLAGLAVASGAAWAVFHTLRRCQAGALWFGLGFVMLAIGAVGVDLGFELAPPDQDAEFFSVWLEELFELPGVTLMVFGALQALGSAPVGITTGLAFSVRAAER